MPDFVWELVIAVGLSSRVECQEIGLGIHGVNQSCQFPLSMSYALHYELFMGSRRR